VRIPETPEVDAQIRKILGTKQKLLIGAHPLRELFKTQLPKDPTPGLRSLDEMMFREITFDREGIEVTAYNLTNAAPIILKNGSTIHFENHRPDRLK